MKTSRIDDGPSSGSENETEQRVGSEIGHLVRRELPARRKVVPHGGCGMHLRERATRFLRRLYATASHGSRCACDTVAGERRRPAASSSWGAAMNTSLVEQT
jgi:hypothetical protein